MMNKTNTPNKSGTTFQKVATIVLSLGVLLSTGACLMNILRWLTQIDATQNTSIMILITGVTTIILYILLGTVED